MFAFRVERRWPAPAIRAPAKPAKSWTADCGQHLCSIGQQEHLFGLETLMFPGLRSGSSDQPNPLHINSPAANQQNGRIVWSPTFIATC